MTARSVGLSAPGSRPHPSQVFRVDWLGAQIGPVAYQGMPNSARALFAASNRSRIDDAAKSGSSERGS